MIAHEWIFEFSFLHGFLSAAIHQTKSNLGMQGAGEML
jgi:hypothetical protein